MNIEERNFENIEKAAHALADDLGATLRKAISGRGRSLLGVSGGRTPRLVFERLRRLDINWKQVTITLTDERWVPPGHPDSNENLVRTHLLRDRAAAANFVPLYGGEETPQKGQSACEARLKSLPLPFDAVYLGMGGDGHFASLFPGDPAVEVRESFCVSVVGTESRLPRMSLTAPTILNAGKIFLLFSGADKHAKYTEAVQEGPYEEVPLRLILSQQQTPVNVLSAP